MTTYLSVSATMAQYLEDNGVGNFSGAGTITTFVGLLPNTPDQCISIFDRPGVLPLMTLTGSGAPESTIDQPQFQVRVRSEADDYVGGNSLVQLVYKTLQGLCEVMLPANPPQQLFHLVTAVSSPGYLGIDVSQRHEWSQTFRCIYNDASRG